jgi:hypothetical protein
MKDKTNDKAEKQIPPKKESIFTHHKNTPFEWVLIILAVGVFLGMFYPLIPYALKGLINWIGGISLSSILLFFVIYLLLKKEKN